MSVVDEVDICSINSMFGIIGDDNANWCHLDALSMRGDGWREHWRKLALFQVTLFKTDRFLPNV